MNSVAQFAPSEFVLRLQSIAVDNYSNSPVNMRKYICGYSLIDPDRHNAENLKAAMQRILISKPEASFVTGTSWVQLFTGQGTIAKFSQAFSLINKYSSEFAAISSLKPFFEKDDFIQDMIDKKCFGVDCIGFVGNYFMESNVFPDLQIRKPLQWSASFPFITSLEQVDSDQIHVVMFANGLHIQLFDQASEVQRPSGQPPYIKVRLSQSSANGPQTSTDVTIRENSNPEFLDVDKFRAGLKGVPDAELAARDAELRRDQSNYKHGHIGWGNGAVFTIYGDGDPANPTGAQSVYIGKAPNGLRRREKIYSNETIERPAAIFSLDRK